MKEYIKPTTTIKEMGCTNYMLTTSQAEIPINNKPLDEGEWFDE